MARQRGKHQPSNENDCHLTPAILVLPAVPLFAGITGTMAESDHFNRFVIDSEILLFSAAPARLPGRIEALQSPGKWEAYVRPWAPQTP